MRTFLPLSLEFTPVYILLSHSTMKKKGDGLHEYDGNVTPSMNIQAQYL